MGLKYMAPIRIQALLMSHHLPPPLCVFATLSLCDFFAVITNLIELENVRPLFEAGTKERGFITFRP
jgi:hypothetical protein